jgi:hypothetical protein
MQDFEWLIIPFLIELAVLAYVLLIKGGNEVSDRDDAPASLGAQVSRSKVR